jgi:hypothetical protein
VTWFTEANDVLRRAIKVNIVDPRPLVIQRQSMCKGGIMSALMQTLDRQIRTLPSVSPWLEKQSSWQLPATRRYSQSRFPPVVPTQQPNAALDWMAEVARFPVPYGSIGIVKSLEQYVQQGQSVYSASPNWGNPFALGGVSIRWYLRLSSIAHLGDPWVSISGAAAIPDRLPGIAYDDLSRTDDIWFPAASCASTNIHLVIPGDYVLRVFCIVGASQDAVSIALRLAGSVQIETNNEAQYTLRTSW